MTGRLQIVGFVIVVAAVVGFALPAYGHATLDLTADAQAPMGLAVTLVGSLPLVGAGWLLGLAVDWVMRHRPRPVPKPSPDPRS